ASELHRAALERAEDLLVAAELPTRKYLNLELPARLLVDALGEFVPVDVNRLPGVAGVRNSQRFLRQRRRRHQRGKTGDDDADDQPDCLHVKSSFDRVMDRSIASTINRSPTAEARTCPRWRISDLPDRSRSA